MEKQLKQNARQNAWNDLFATASRINDYHATHEEEIKRDGMQEPYDPLSGQPAFELLLHHIDFIYRYWLYREDLKEDERKGFENWIDEVFFQWLSLMPTNREKLFKDFQVVIARKDLYSDKFLEWLKNQQKHSRYLGQ